MMNRRKLYTYVTALAAALSAASCSTTSNLPEDETLYTGIKSIDVEGKKGTAAESTALTEVEAALAYAPNNSFMGSSSVRFPLPIGLWIYNEFVDNQETWLSKWLFKSFGSTPRTISQANPSTRSKVATNLLQNYGYFQGYVDYDLVNQRNPKKQKISYKVKLSEPYALDSIKFAFPEKEDSIVRATGGESYLAQGDQFSVSNLQSERTRLAEAFRDNGFYYYRSDYISYYADSMQTPYKVKLLVVPNKDMPDRAKKQWRIGDISAYIRDNKSGMMGAYTDSVNLRGLKIAYTGDKMPIKPRVMFRNFRFWSGRLYNQSKADETVTNLNNMDIFSQVKFTYTPRLSADSVPTLDVRLDATMDKLLDAEVEFNVTQKSNSQVGPNLAVTLSKRNAFRHGETLSVKLKGSYEWQTNKSVEGKSSKINSYEYGLETSISYPWTAFPWLNKKIFRYPTSTEFKLSVDNLNRAGYYKLMSFGAEASYTFQSSRYVTHRFVPITVTYNKLKETSARFDSIRETNSALYISLRDQFIPAMQYTYRFDNSGNSRYTKTTSLELTVKESANALNAINGMLGHGYSRKDKKLIGSPYSQFLKATLDLRHKIRLTQTSQLATRFQVGAIWTYGNSTVAPYSELFFAGGANSIRAFAVRSIGPGSYYDRTRRGTYLDQAGDFKLEANVEYRFNMVSNLYGALFVDAGNVWLLKQDDAHPGGQLKADKFLDDIALGTGFGLRYDLEFLVLRLDLGIGIHAPYETSRKGYYNIPKFKDGLGLHFAVGYPF